MEFFQKFYSDVQMEGDEVKVLCPFHSDTHPSASINTNDSLFYCHVCQWGGNEEQFIAKLNNISRKNAAKLLGTFQSIPHDWEETYQVDLWADADFLSKVRSLGITNNTIEELKLGLVEVSGKKFLGVPVFYNKILVDIRRYNLLKYSGAPKMIGNSNVQNGHVIPYDLWDRSLPTYVFEGEKDMIMARELGLNAITLTGGAGATPNDITLPAFKDVEVIVCYDNDDAGRKGMDNLYLALEGTAKSVRYIDIGQVVEGEKEDFYDYIHKYKGDVFEFLSLDQQEFAIARKQVLIKHTPINKALAKSAIKRKLFSEVTVASEFADTYAVPTIVKFRKTKESGKKNEVMLTGETRSWFLETGNQDDLLPLIEADAKSRNVTGQLRKYVGIPSEEEFVEMLTSDFQTVYKCSVVDKVAESNEDGSAEGSMVSLDLYTFEKLNVGGQYDIEYTIYNHPTKHQKLVGICSKFEEIGSNASYRANPQLLKQLQTTGTVEERVDKLYQSAKHHIAKHLDFSIWLMSDLVFNSVLEFDYGERISGALDVFVLGDTQVGKSEATTKMTRLYNFGHFLSLKTSSTVGLIGGSNKVEGSWCNTIGAIPRQHKRLVVLEEFSGAKPDFIKTMTDIRTSKRLRLARASGELEVPCHLRMITISNPVNDEDGTPKFLSTFPNGVTPIMELIKSAEDVARYDAFLLVPRISKRFNPFSTAVLKGEPIPKEVYEHKSDWVTTRKPENVKFAEGVEGYIWEKGEELNDMFECNFPVFGTTTSKKVARMSVALASLIMNVSDDYEDIIVTKEIVDYLVEYLKNIYTSKAFRLDAYKAEYDSYHEYTDEDIKALEILYPANSILFDFLSKQSRTTRSNLRTVSGLEGDKFNPLFNQLVTHRFIRLNMETVYPTEKFRRVFPKIKKITSSSGHSLVDSLSRKEQ